MPRLWSFWKFSVKVHPSATSMTRKHMSPIQRVPALYRDKIVTKTNENADIPALFFLHNFKPKKEREEWRVKNDFILVYTLTKSNMFKWVEKVSHTNSGAQTRALWQPRGWGWGGTWEGGNICYLRLIHVGVWQKPTQYFKAIIQLKINLKKKFSHVDLRYQNNPISCKVFQEIKKLAFIFSASVVS